MPKLLILVFLLSQTAAPPQSPEQLAQRYSMRQLHDRALLGIGFSYGFAVAAPKFDNSDAVLQHSCRNLDETDALLAQEVAKGRLDKESKEYIAGETESLRSECAKRRSR